MPRAERRKREKEKLLIESAAKIPKLTSFFKSVSNHNVPADTVVELEGDVNCEPSSVVTPVASPDADNSDNSSNPNMPLPELLSEMSAEPLTLTIPDEQAFTSNSSACCTSTENVSSPQTGGSGALPACLDSCCSMVNETPFHPTDDIIKRTSTKQSTSRRGKVRTCPSSIFGKYTWVTYCMTKGTIACFFCKKAKKHGLITFSNNGADTFSSGEFSNWKKCYEKLKKHSESKYHQEATEKVLCFDDTKCDIAAAMVSELKKSQETRRRMLMKQLSTLRCLARQGISLQGKTDIESNLIQFLKVRAEDVPELMDWVKERRYLSHDIINELINIMANEVLRSIVADIHQESKLFSIISDESRDISNKEQLTNVLRWVSKTDLSIHEDFLGMYQVEKTDAETITICLKDVLLRCNLKIEDCRWQTYDGAANMSGCLSGVAARIMSENPRALYIHCANHTLDLALKDCVKQSKIIHNTLGLVQELAVFIRASPTRMAQYQYIASSLEENNTHVENPHLLCPTRWTVRTKAISAIVNNYEALHSTFLSIAKEATKASVRDTANGLAAKLKKFDTCFGLRFAQNIFSVCEQVAITLQNPSVTAQTTVTCIESLKYNLKDQRSNLGHFYNRIVALNKSFSFIEDPVLPRQTQVPRRLQHGNCEQHYFQSVEDLYRVQCSEAIDVCLLAINERFDQQAFSVLSNVETALISAANGLDYDLNDVVTKLYKDDCDFEQLIIELNLLKGVINQRLPEVKKVTSIDTITSLFCTDEEAPQPQINLALPNVVRLLQIYLLAPMSAASAERSFSGQRRVKTYLRSTMTETRYSNLMVLHVNKDRTDKLDLEVIAKHFVQKNDRRIRFFGKL